MDGLLALILTIVGLVTLDVAALTAGSDSRDSLPDDHRR